jgi:hypothetical protein
MWDVLSVRNTAVAVGVLSFINLALFTYFHKTKKTCKGFSHWYAASFLFCIAIILFALRNIIPDFLSIVIANGLFVFCLSLITHGMNLLMERVSTYIVDVVCVVGAYVSLSYYTFVIPDLGMRVLFLSTFISILLLHYAISTWNQFNRQEASIPHIVHFGILGLGLWHTLKVLGVLSNLFPMVDYIKDNCCLNICCNTTMFFFLCCMAYGVIQLHSDDSKPLEFVEENM